MTAPDDETKAVLAAYRAFLTDLSGPAAAGVRPGSVLANHDDVEGRFLTLHPEWEAHRGALRGAGQNWGVAVYVRADWLGDDPPGRPLGKRK